MKTVAAAIDFGTSKVVTMLAESGGRSRCEILGAGVRPYDGYMDGQWNAPEKLNMEIRASINAAELESKRRIKEIYVGVPSTFLKVRSTQAEVKSNAEDGRIEDACVDAALDAAADSLDLRSSGEVIIHRSPAWFQVEGGKKDMTPVGRKGQTLRTMVSFITADAQFVRDMRARFSEMGVSVIGFLSPSMGEALWLITMEERDRSAVLIDVGYLSTEVMVVEGDALTFHTVVPLGAGHVTMDIAQRLTIKMRIAEEVKRQFSFIDDEFEPAGDPEVVGEDGRKQRFPRAEVRETVEARVDEIAEMLAEALIRAQAFTGARAQVYLTGGGLAMMQGGREYLGGQLKRVIKTPTQRASRLNTPAYASSWGLIDLLFDSIESHSPDNDSLSNRLKGGLRGLVRR